MNTDRLPAIRDRVQRVFEQADLAEEPEVKSDLACLACILTSAMIEVSCRQFVCRYAERRAGPTVASYITAKLYYFQNAKTEDIDCLLRAFSSDLANTYFSKIGEECRDAIDSVVNKKNEIVHGKGAGIGLDTMKRYYEDVRVAMDVFRDLMTDPSTP